MTQQTGEEKKRGETIKFILRCESIKNPIVACVNLYLTEKFISWIAFNRTRIFYKKKPTLHTVSNVEFVRHNNILHSQFK